MQAPVDPSIDAGGVGMMDDATSMLKALLAVGTLLPLRSYRERQPQLLTYSCIQPRSRGGS